MNTFDRLLRTTVSYTDYKQEIEYMYLKKGYIIPMLNYIRNTNTPYSNELIDNYILLKKRIPAYKQNIYYQKDYITRILIFMLHYTPRFAIFALPRLLRFSHYNSIV